MENQRKPRKMPIRCYEVGVPVRYLMVVTVQATSRAQAEEIAKGRAAKRSDTREPYLRRVKHG